MTTKGNLYQNLDDNSDIKEIIRHLDYILEKDDFRELPEVEGIESSQLIQSINNLIRRLKITNNYNNSAPASASPEGFWEWNLIDNTFHFSAEICEIYGLDKTQNVIPIEQVVNTFIHPDDIELVLLAVGSVLDPDSWREWTFRIVRPDKEIRWVESKVHETVKHDENGHPLIIKNVLKDITDERNAESRIKEYEQKLLLHRKQTPLAIIEWNTDFEVIDWNPAAQQTFGYSKMEAMGRKAVDIIVSPDLAHKSEDVWKNIVEFKKSLNFKAKNLTKTGEIILCQWYSTPLVDKNNQVIGIVSIAHDITNRVNAEQSLLIFRRAVESNSDAIVIFRPSGEAVFQNNAFSSLFGYETPDHLYDAGGYKTLFENIADKTEIDRYLLKGESWHGEVKFVSRNGDRMTVLLRADSIKTDAGKIQANIFMHTDITKRKQTEEELINAKMEAEQVNEYLQLTTAKANEMAARAEEANAAKSAFLANMSHEIRTPMNGIIGMSSLLIDTDLTKEQLEYTEVIRSSGDALLSLINDILDFSKVEAGKLELEIIEFDVRHTISDVIYMLYPAASKKELSIYYRVKDDVPRFLRGDPSRIRQILTNLSSNAIKFTNEGEVSVKISVKEQTKDETTLLFEVADTGIGIEKKTINNLFKPFTQADSSTTRKFGGTGLGLSISKTLSEIMGGEIGVESTPGKGSIFWFTIKLGNSQKDKSSKLVMNKSLRNKKILIVDDNLTNSNVFEHMIKLWGCKTHSVTNANDALKALRTAYLKKEPFDIAIVDFLMPDIDGETLARLIRKDSKLNNDIQMIMLTSAGTKGDSAKMFKAGFSAYLSKPINKDDLYRCLMTIINQNHSKNPNQIITRYSLHEDQQSNMSILLVEDNPTNQQVASSMLKKLGFRADIVGNGKEAVEALKLRPYDLIFMDCQMPEMDGFEATKHIRQMSSNIRTTPIIAMTANAMQGDRERCIKSGMDDYIAKPVKPVDLGNAIARWGGAKVILPPKKKDNDMPVDKEVFNKSNMLENMMNDKSLAQTVIDAFLLDIPKQIKILEEAIQKEDVDQITLTAHSIKGAASNVCASKLQNVAFVVEKAGEAKDVEKANSYLDDIKSEFDMLKSVLVI